MAKKSKPLEEVAEEVVARIVDDQETLELLEAIREKENQVWTAQASFDQAKEEAKYRKQVFEKAIANLRKLVRCGFEPAPLFDDPKDENEDPRLNLMISRLDLPQIIFKLFDDANIITLGDISAWTKGNKLIDIKGIGESKAEEIETALEKFWEETNALAERKTDGKESGA